MAVRATCVSGVTQIGHLRFALVFVAFRAVARFRGNILIMVTCLTIAIRMVEVGVMIESGDVRIMMTCVAVRLICKGFFVRRHEVSVKDGRMTGTAFGRVGLSRGGIVVTLLTWKLITSGMLFVRENDLASLVFQE